MNQGQPKEYWPAASACLLFALVYWAQVWATPGHCTSYDSWQYLELSEKIRQGHFLPTLDAENQLGRPFNPYGLGFPYAIALASLVTQLPSLWASKVVNFGLVCLGMWRLSSTGKLSPWAILPVLSSPFLFLTTHTWSEGMLLGAGLNLAASATQKDKAGVPAWSLAAVLARTQGIFLVAGVLAMLMNGLSKKKAIGTALACIGLLLASLGMEATTSGMLTGGERPAAATSYMSFGYEALTQSFKSFVWIWKNRVPGWLEAGMGLLILATCGIGLKALIRKPFQEAVLLSSGLFYYTAAIPILFFFAFAEGVDIRFLGPGLLLAQTGLLGQLKSRKPWAAIAAAGVVATLNLPWKALLAAL